MSNVSYWSNFTPPSFEKLGAPAHFDVVVVGAGITGLTTAYLLKQRGKRVCVLERDHIGSGETSHTSAHVTYVTDLYLHDLAKRFGEDNAALVWRGSRAAIDLIEELTRTVAIDCGFERVPNFLYSSPAVERDESDDLRQEQEVDVRLGFPAEFMENGPIANQPAIRYPNQAIIHPLRYLAGLAQAVHGDGCVVYDHSEAEEFSDEPLSVTANGHRITCDDLVIATHVPMTGVKNMLGAMLFQTKLFPYSSYVLHATIPSTALAPGLYNDTADPYYYLRVHDEDGVRHAIFGGRDHKTGQSTDTDECFRQLESYFSGLFPDAHITHRWSGQVIETSDGLPFIGEATAHQYIATGYSGNGLTFGTLAATIIRDQLLGISSEYTELFDPSRKKLFSGLASVVSENVDFPLYLLRDRLRHHDSEVGSIKRGEGKVLSIDGKHVAAHRKDDETIVAVSAVCTHLGCLVRWNQSEATWDCPCHGSRFLPSGEVIGGPAESPLETIPLTDASK